MIPTERPRAVRRPLAELAHNRLVARLGQATKLHPDYRADLRRVVAPLLADPFAELHWTWWLTPSHRGRELERSLAVAAWWPPADDQADDEAGPRPIGVWPVRVLADRLTS